MVETKLLLHIRVFSLGFIFCWLLSSALASAEDSPGPNCIQALSGVSKSCDADTIGKGSPFYSVSCKPIVNLAFDSCEFHSNQRLRIGLERFAPISHVLLKEPTFVGKFIRNVTIWNGITSRECKYSEKIVVDVGQPNKNQQQFAKFSCGDSNGPAGLFMANAIDINSIVHRTVNLTSLQTTGQLDWMILMHAGTTADFGAFAEKKPTVIESSGERLHFRHAIDSSHGTFGNDWNETKRNNNTSPSSDGKPSKQCPPVSPYHGMPENYKNYQLVSDESINELLLTKPCRPGYKLVGSISDITQCINGIWQGKGFPKCEVTRTSTPPNVEHATWNYVREDAFHEIVYTCDVGYYLAPSGTGKAIHSPETDEWIGVPQCEQPLPVTDHDDERFMQDKHWLIICAVAACAFGVLVTVIVVLKLKNRKLKRANMEPTTQYDYVQPNNNARRHSSISICNKFNLYEEINDDVRPLNKVQPKQPDVLLTSIKTDSRVL